MGGKGATPQNSQMVQFEREQAAKAEAKEALRKSRLEQGMKSIGETFHGKPVMGTKAAKLDLTGITGAASPAASGFKITGEKPAGGFNFDTPMQIGDTGWHAFTGTEPSGGPAHLIYDPTGGLRGVGASFEQATQNLGGTEYMKPYETGEFESDPFGVTKEKYKTNLTELHGRNLNTTYNKALEEALYGISRAGLRGSTTAKDLMKDVGGVEYQAQEGGGFRQIPYGQYGEAKTQIKSDIDKSLSDLNTQIQSAEDAAENQLYMTEDPEVAANEAKKLAGNIPVVPTYNTLGDMFKPLVIGATGFYSGFQGQNDFNRAFGGRSINKSSGQETST
jgi:hypothetical protein